MTSLDSTLECSVCRLPFFASAGPGDRTGCPFCDRTFGRPDGARRHTRSCPAKGNRPVPPEAKRGRKLRACDACSRVKVSCNAKLPCQRCSSRSLACTFRRFCTDPTHRDGGQRPQLGETFSALRFLLNCTDAPSNFINDVVVPAEPERDPATPPAWSRNSTGTVDGESTALPDTIDPRLLFVGFIDPYFGTSLDDEGVVDNRDVALMFPATPTAGLATQVRLLEADIQQYFEAETELSRSSVQTFFTHANFNKLMNVFFRRQQLLARMIHMPTFDPGQADLGLLLAIALCGAGYSGVSMEPLAVPTRALQRVAEKYVFQRLKRCPVKDDRDDASRCRTLQACQAAYLITFIQLGENDGEIRRRIITKRQPALLNAVRRLGLISDKPRPPSVNWREFIYRESCVRLVSWVFFTEGLLALFCNSPPLATVSEMCDELPCRDELWDADSAASFAEELGQEAASPCLSMKDLQALLLGDDWEGEAATACHGLTVFHLYAVIGVFQLVLFNYRASMLPKSFSVVLLRALSRWENLWRVAMEQIAPDQRDWIGVSKYSPEFALISKRIVQVSNSRYDSRYLRCTIAYDLKAFHEFILQYGSANTATSP